ncbi:MAG TPA: protein kinase [Candidatus Polarisedimenticolia bacterium]|nr:protein kinase [Candidatus Polarisedimenticolia bacterium]
MIGQTIAHYRVTAKLGEGGMGEVYKAEDTRLGRIVALKFLTEKLSADAQAVERFQREAHAASALNHPHICTIHDIGETNGRHFIVMEHLEGQTLKQAISERRLEISEILRFGMHIADALNAAHAAGIVHHDIKPSNVFVTRRGDAKLLDFGLATYPRAPAEIAETGSSEEIRVAAGTIPYMAPEQLCGEPGDARTDLYALGATLYEMATGQLPFFASTVAALVRAILYDPPIPPGRLNPEVPRPLEEIILKCLEKKQESRYQSALDLMADLSRAETPHFTEKSVVVLYFENLSGMKEDEYFRDGMTEDIITELSKIKPLRVFPRSAVLMHRDKPVTASEVGRRLGASHVLEGTLRRAGHHLRINAQLVDSSSGHSLWAEKYDWEMKDIFGLQDEIACSISEALRITLSPQEAQAIASKPTSSHQAYDYYLRGRSYARRCTRSDLELAIEMYGHAISLDSRFALAYAGVAIAYGLLYDWHEKNPRWIEKAVEAAEHARTLEPELPEALAAYARLRWSQRNYDEAIRFALEAIRHKPDCENAYWTLGQAYFASDRWAEAAAIAGRAVELGGADYNVHIPYMMAFERLGQDAAAQQLRQRHIQALEQHLERVPDDMRARILLANNYAHSGNERDATRQMQLALELRPHDSNILYNAACTYGILKNRTEAVAAFKKALAAGFVAFEYAARDPDLACLHGDPEFEDLLEELRNKEASKSSTQKATSQV